MCLFIIVVFFSFHYYVFSLLSLNNKPIDIYFTLVCVCIGIILKKIVGWVVSETITILGKTQTKTNKNK